MESIDNSLRIFEVGNMKVPKEEMTEIWHAFGNFISRQMRNGKGVGVSRFGNFTFTAQDIDLAGTTNPNERDRQTRTPVFIISKDLAAGLRPGICGIRPFDNQGASGIIPKVKVNYSDIGIIAGKSKDQSRIAIERVIRNIADRIKKGDDFSIEIPMIGTLQIRNRIAGVIFEADLLEDTKGSTAKNHYMGKLFSSGIIKHNMQQITHNHKMFGCNLKKSVEGSIMSPLANRIMKRTNSAKISSRLELKDDPYKMIGELNIIGSRPLSSHSRVSTQVPELSRVKIMQIAQSIIKASSQLIQNAQLSNNGTRNKLSSADHLNLLRKVGIILNIGHLKALLRDINLPYSGITCSVIELIKECKNYVESIKAFSGNDMLVVSDSYEIKPTIEILMTIKDALYTSGHDIKQIYQNCCEQGKVEREGFINCMMHSYGVSLNERDLFRGFTHVSNGKQYIMFDDFNSYFNWQSDFQDIHVIKKLRTWMYSTGFSAEEAFEQLCKIKADHTHTQLNREEFHKAINQNRIQMTVAQIDHSFKILDTDKNNYVTIDEWMDKVYEDMKNPLQLLREIINQNELTSDDILFKMRLKIWDDPLIFPSFQKAIRLLDPTFSNNQIRYLFKSLKNTNDKIDVISMIRNLCGEQFETVDYRDSMYIKLYEEIYKKGKGKEFKQLCTKLDCRYDGTLEPHELKTALYKIAGSKILNEQAIERMVRFIDKTNYGRVDYMKFISNMHSVSNTEHNPLKSLVHRLQQFFKQNKQDIIGLIRKLALSESSEFNDKVSHQTFAKFIKMKVDKKRDISELTNLVSQMDIDRDGYLGIHDMNTCLGNLDNDRFYEEHGEMIETRGMGGTANKFCPNQKLSEQDAVDVCKTIRTSLTSHSLSFREFFNRMDKNKDGLLSYNEFSCGLDDITQLSQPIKEKLFAYIDINQIGMLVYENFLNALKNTSLQRVVVNDNFDWEIGVIERIKQWIKKERITIDEGFKLFDHDFDGMISKQDLQYSLKHIIKEKMERISSIKIDRLFSLLDYYKTGKVQISDFYRIIEENSQFNSVFDWKLNALRQLGLYISKKFHTLQESFEVVSEKMGKISLQSFQHFIDSKNVLEGMNMTFQLIQQLFSEIDPHKKGFLTKDDWNNAFININWKKEIISEIKNLIQCSFTDISSAYEYFLSMSQQKDCLLFKDFEKAVNQLGANRFKKAEINTFWKNISQSNTQIDKGIFIEYFQNLRYGGTNTFKRSSGMNTLYTQSSIALNQKSNVIEKLRYQLKTSKNNMYSIFREIDKDNKGKISANEFRQALRKLGIGLSSKEIDKVITFADKNGDGCLDWLSFVDNFKNKVTDNQMIDRTKFKIAKIKELIMQFMVSPIDAFRFYDSNRHGKLTYTEFSKLIVKLFQMAGEDTPTYQVIKDLFDYIDIRKDGIIDNAEWTQSFNIIQEGDKKFTILRVQEDLQAWENSLQYSKIIDAISRNRKMLLQGFDNNKKRDGLISYGHGKEVLQMIIGHLQLEDSQYCHLFKCAQTTRGDIDYRKFLKIQYGRVLNLQQHPF